MYAVYLLHSALNIMFARTVGTKSSQKYIQRVVNFLRPNRSKKVEESAHCSTDRSLFQGLYY